MTDHDTHDTNDEQALPSVRLSVTREEALGLLEKRARQGKLAGFALEHEGFKCDAFGTPFDADLVGRFSNGTIDFVLRRRLRMPIAVWVCVVFAIWPGAWMMHSLLATYFDSYPWFGLSGLIWQLIFALLTATAIPILLKQQKSSRLAQHEHGLETIGKIEKWLGSASA